MSTTDERADDSPSNNRSTDERSIRSLSDVRAVLEFGHPVLGDVGALLSNLHVSPTGASGASGASASGATSASDTAATADTGQTSSAPSSAPSSTQTPPESTPTQFAEVLSSHVAMVDRLRAHELVHLATAALTLALTRRRSEDRLEYLLADEESDCAGSDGAGSSAFAGATAVEATSLSLEDPERFLTREEYLLEREHEAVFNVRLNARTGDSRRRVGLALTAYIGMPLLLRSMLTGQIRFNRWEALTRKLKHLPLTHLHALDVFLAGLDPRFSLGQFLRHAASFLAQFETKPVLAARARSERSVWVEHLPDGLAIHCMKGPAALIESHHAATRAAASAIWKNQLTNMTVTRTDRPMHAEGGPTQSGVAALPDLSRLSRSDDRSIRQLMFDVLIGAAPRTQTVLERVTGDGETVERYHVDIVCPDQATVLRKQATVVVTVPMTTLLGLDDRPGTIAGEPLPADMARTIAASSRFWYRMLTDPATGQVLDEVALKYKPDKATRLSVLGKWQTCTLPGCSRPAQECEIDHGIPFNHDHPECGGRTEPANLHPLCTSHHQAKTDGRIRMRRTADGGVDWLLPLGTTATTVAPSVDDGGVLTAACAPEDTEARREARRTVERRTIRDPQTNRRVADAAFDQAGRDFVAAEHAREKRRTVWRAEMADVIQEQARVRRWAEETRQELQDREDSLREQEASSHKRERNLTRDERLASLAHARAEAKLDEAKRLTASATAAASKSQELSARSSELTSEQASELTSEQSPEKLSGKSAAHANPQEAAQPGPAADRVRYRTLIPMRVEHLEFGHGLTGSLHTPVFFGVQPLRTEEAPPTGTARRRSSTAANLSIVEDGMATALHDAFAQRRILIVGDGFGVGRTPKPEPEPKPKPEPGSSSGDPFTDDPPPF